MTGDLLDELRVLAKDGGRLTAADCALIERAADELENLGRQLAFSQVALTESQQHRVALHEANMRLIAMVSVSSRASASFGALRVGASP